MLGEHKHLQQTLRDHGGVTATAMVEQAHCLGTETNSGFHGTTFGYWFALKVAVKADGVEPFDASLRAFVHNYVSEGETIPRVGWNQRSRASSPRMLPVASSTCG